MANSKEYWAERWQRVKAERHAADPPDPIDLLSDVQVAYLAGLFDGEGCLTIIKHTQDGLIKLIPTAQVIMTAEAAIRELAGLLGVTVKVRPGRGGYLPQYEFRVAGRRAIRLCRRMRPFLLVKAQQADLLMAFEPTYDGCLGQRNHRLSDAARLRREELKRAISALNRPGR